MQARATRLGGHNAPTALATLVAAIFASTPASAWYDPSDLSTMYQDNLGQTAVTAVEQPVGFIMDKSKGGAPRGADVVVNGGFDSDLTNWTTPVTAPGTVVVTGGRAVLDSGVADGGGIARLRQALTVTPGWYEVVFDIVAFSGSAVNSQIAIGSDTSGGSQYLAASVSSVGTQRRVFYVSTTTLGIAFFVSASGTRSTATIDNFSIKPISGANRWTGAPSVNNGSWVDNADGSYTNAGNTGTIGYTGRLVIGKTYEAVIRVTARTSGTFYLPYDGVGPNAIIISAVATYRRVFTASTTSLYIYSNAFVGTVASIHVQELPTLVPLTQATSTSRPVLAARVNFLTQTEALSNAAWSKGGAGTASAPVVTDNFGVAPDGTTTAARVQMALNGGTTTSDYSTIHQSTTIQNGGNYSHGVWLKTNDGTTKVVLYRDDVGTPGVQNLLTVTGTWQFFSQQNLTMTTGSSNTVKLWLRGTLGTADSADLLMWHPQFETGPALGSYQRVAAATDYDWLGFPLYLRFDGTDDSMATGGAAGTVNFDLSGTDKVTALACIHKGSDAAVGIVTELGPNTSDAANPGSFFMAAPASVAANWGARVRGVDTTVVAPTSPPAPTSGVLTSQFDIATSLNSLRVNGALALSTNVSLGGGNFGSYPLYVGARGGSSLRFNGRLYGLLIFGRQLTPDQLFLSERYVGQLMGIAL